MSLFAIATRKLFDNSSSPLLTKNPHLCVPSFEGYGQKADIREPGVPLIATHTPYTCLPKSVLDCSPDHCKIVYICREPKDAFVSLFHYAAKRRPTENEPISLEVAFHLFCEGKSFFGPCWDHILEHWKASQERPDKVMFLKYEDMLNDSVLYVKKLAEFMGYPFSSDEEQVGAVQKIVDLCSFENLNNLEKNKTGKRFPFQRCRSNLSPNHRSILLISPSPFFDRRQAHQPDLLSAAESFLSYRCWLPRSDFSSLSSTTDRLSLFAFSYRRSTLAPDLSSLQLLDVADVAPFPLSKADIREPGVPLIATHAPYPSLPKSVLDCSSDHCKIVDICREPKDAFVSMFHFAAKRRSKEIEPISLEEAFHLFCEGKSVFGPCWDHILQYWKASQERPDKVMFLKYEDMLNDSVLYVKKLAELMGYPFSSDEEQVGAVQEIVDLCSFENLSNLEINKTGKRYAGDSEATNKSFFRKGKVGDWQNYLTMAQRLDKIMEQKLSGSGLTFELQCGSRASTKAYHLAMQ
ncbi:hypothetical protein QUC31_010408 [Theobroma cacao]